MSADSQNARSQDKREEMREKHLSGLTLEEAATKAAIPTHKIGDIFVTMRGKRSPVCKAYTCVPPHGKYVCTFPPNSQLLTEEIDVVLIPADKARKLKPQWGIAIKTNEGWVNVTRGKTIFALPQFARTV